MTSRTSTLESDEPGLKRNDWPQEIRAEICQRTGSKKGGARLPKITEGLPQLIPELFQP